MAPEDIGDLESLQILLQQNPDSLTFARVAEALMKKGRLDEAIQICEDGVRRHPYYVTGHMVLGKCYLKKKLGDQAEKEFKRVLLLDPQYLAAHKYYGDWMREIGWDNTCEMSYRKILHLDPLDSAVKAVVEEFARKSKGEKTAMPPPPPSTKPQMPPPAREDFPATTDFGEEEFLRYEAPAPQRKKKTPAEFEETSESVYATTPADSKQTLPPGDEERFSYILDDIFQDEVSEEKAPPAPGDDELSLQTGTDQISDFPEEEEPEPSEPHGKPALHRRPFETGISGSDDAAEQSPRLASKIKTRPVDFDLDFDEVPPAARPDSGMDSPRTPTPFEFDIHEHEEDKNSAHPVSRPGTAPARRARIHDDFTAGEEPAPLPSSGEREKIVTPTLGEIYAAQGQYAKAIGVFELLSKKEPNNRHYREKIDYLKKRLQETQNAG
ncbi:MAG: tetratricopeptide repeat protein [candidate division KSB1 bacterium]|nr:tetratricopeptide repeat protein [candidate division KSB1 bacterium]MDZ7303426.1 tetratricopeptide repeat protein [candidate division KSB1 bacterium]MDZ7312508.1 tetratricopeptide repeat protein [candidate division KSB1 bacterium]